MYERVALPMFCESIERCIGPNDNEWLIPSNQTFDNLVNRSQ